ncbi:MAG: ester cyclase [Anaerolineaceae bacterium]|nr:MAG: ester cyclase [Anaerolineaceae bacterium]
MLRTINKSHAPNLRTLSSNGRRFYGRNQLQSFYLSLLAFEIDDLYWMGNDSEGYLTAMRWSIIGRHCGWGIYGPPTGRPVHIWGITQHHIQNGLIVEEWMLFNEFEVMQQIFHD